MADEQHNKLKAGPHRLDVHPGQGGRGPWWTGRSRRAEFFPVARRSQVLHGEDCAISYPMCGCCRVCGRARQRLCRGG